MMGCCFFRARSYFCMLSDRSSYFFGLNLKCPWDCDPKFILVSGLVEFLDMDNSLFRGCWTHLYIFPSSDFATFDLKVGRWYLRLAAIMGVFDRSSTLTYSGSFWTFSAVGALSVRLKSMGLLRKLRNFSSSTFCEIRLSSTSYEPRAGASSGGSICSTTSPDSSPAEDSVLFYIDSMLLSKLMRIYSNLEICCCSDSRIC